MEGKTKKRPFWHKDAQWILGIFLAFSLCFTIIFYNLYILSAEENAIEILTTRTATMFSRKGLDDDSELDEALKKAQESPDGRYKPIPALDSYITVQDIQGNSPRELRLKIFRQVVEPVYKEGPNAIKKKFASTGSENEVSLGFFEFINTNTHNLLGKIFFVSLSVTILIAALVIRFSYRFGKLFAPGVVLVFVSLLPAALLSFLNFAIRSNPLAKPTGEGIGPQTTYLVNVISPMILPTIARTYLYVLILGIILILSAIVGKIIWRKRETK